MTVATAAVTSVFQPIVDLDTLEVVGYEALARGLAGESPAQMFSRAYADGSVLELDWACRAAAYEGALAAGFDRTTTLFVNVEPSSLGLPAPDAIAHVQGLAQHRLRVVLELTERAITARPAEMLAAARWARSHGWGIALDDVGADPGSLALLPLLGPDVVKLDLRLVQERPDRDIAAIMTAVLAYAESAGAAVLAEGIETPAHLQAAKSMGARYAQGYLFGRPGPVSRPAQRQVEFLVPATLPSGRTPYEVVAPLRQVRASTKPMLVEMAKHLEAQAAAQPTPAVVLSVFQEGRHFTPATARRYGALARKSPFVLAVGVGLAAQPVPGVRGADIADNDPLADEWSVVVVGAHFGAALVARDLGEGMFDYALTHQRDLVLSAAQSLLSRTMPS